VQAMSENLKTIKELADELGVSKNKIHYQVSKISSEYVVRNNSMKLLTAEAVKQIKENLGIELNSSLNSKLNTVKHQENTNIKGNTSVEGVELNSTLNSYLNSLKHQIEYLESQNINKDEQIKSLVESQKQTQNLLDQQQRLALQDKKLLEEYKSENDSLKALKMPSKDIKKEKVDNQPQEEIENLRNEHTIFQEQLKEKVMIEKKEASKKWWQLWK
jgi:L-rhamnose isomerase